MNSEILELIIGKKIEIATIGTKKEKVYISQVLDMIGPNQYLISGPIHQNNLIFMHTDDEINISYLIENKGKYSFRAKVLSRNYSNIYTLKVERISEIEKIQKRSFYRLSTQLDIEKEHARETEQGLVTYKELCAAKDISGGGMKIICNYEHEIGETVYCSFKLQDTLKQVKATVVRFETLQNQKYKYSIGVSFIEMKKGDIEEIVKYIFENQRILRLKGLI